MMTNETKLEAFTIWLTGSCPKSRTVKETWLPTGQGGHLRFDSLTLPPDIWQVEVLPNGGFSLGLSSGPCLPHRIFQRLFLGFKWKRI